MHSYFYESPPEDDIVSAEVLREPLLGAADRLMLEAQVLDEEARSIQADADRVQEAARSIIMPPIAGILDTAYWVIQSLRAGKKREMADLSREQSEQARR